MALQSGLFRGDAKLEAAAVSDPAHIMPGARGDHVRKIQVALIRLDGADIPTDGVYAPPTAAAVLAYKQKRNIINPSYQAKADNIVGKMTMTALDKEMLAAEAAPVLLVPINPLPRVVIPRSQRGPLLAFNSTGPGLMGVTDLRPIPIHPPSTPGPGVQQVEVIIARGNNGSIRVIGGAGGKLVRSQHMRHYGAAKNLFQVARLNGAKAVDRKLEEIDITNDDTTVTFDALNCGETFFQAQVSPPQPPQKLSEIMRLLSLVDKSTPLPVPPGDYSPHPNLKSGLVSKSGTPLNPLPGRKINFFGEGESAGFEDYSSDIDFCSHSFSNGNGPAGASAGHRPWTADPRKSSGIAPKSVSNICCRSSPIHPVTIREILRIGASKCRVTYAEGAGKEQSDKLRAGLTGARVVDEGTWNGTGGHAIVLELA